MEDLLVYYGKNQVEIICNLPFNHIWLQKQLRFSCLVLNKNLLDQSVNGIKLQVAVGLVEENNASSGKNTSEINHQQIFSQIIIFKFVIRYTTSIYILKYIEIILLISIKLISLVTVFSNLEHSIISSPPIVSNYHYTSPYHIIQIRITSQKKIFPFISEKRTFIS